MIIVDCEVPELPDSVSRDPVRQVDDWSEVADVFGMVPFNLNINSSSGVSKQELVEHTMSLVKMPDLALGDLKFSDTGCVLEVHASKAAYVRDALGGSTLSGITLEISL